MVGFACLAGLGLANEARLWDKQMWLIGSSTLSCVEVLMSKDKGSDINQDFQSRVPSAGDVPGVGTKGGDSRASSMQQQAIHGQFSDVAAASVGGQPVGGGAGERFTGDASKDAQLGQSSDVKTAENANLPPPQPSGVFDPELVALAKRASGVDLSEVTVAFDPSLEKQGKLGVAQAGKSIGLSPKIKGKARKTLAHEFGHVLQHPSSGMVKATPKPGQPIPDVEQEAEQVGQDILAGQTVKIFNSIDDGQYFNECSVRTDGKTIDNNDGSIVDRSCKDSKYLLIKIGSEEQTIEDLLVILERGGLNDSTVVNYINALYKTQRVTTYENEEYFLEHMKTISNLKEASVDTQNSFEFPSEKRPEMDLGPEWIVLEKNSSKGGYRFQIKNPPNYYRAIESIFSATQRSVLECQGIVQFTSLRAYQLTFKGKEDLFNERISQILKKGGLNPQDFFINIEDPLIKTNPLPQASIEATWIDELKMAANINDLSTDQDLTNNLEFILPGDFVIFEATILMSDEIFEQISNHAPIWKIENALCVDLQDSVPLFSGGGIHGVHSASNLKKIICEKINAEFVAAENKHKIKLRMIDINKEVEKITISYATSALNTAGAIYE